MTSKVINLNKRLGRLVETRPVKMHERRHILFDPDKGETAASVFIEKYKESIEAYKTRLKKEDPDHDGLYLLIRRVIHPR